LDYNLIKDFGLEHVLQDEFGRIDNTTGMKVRVTSELFASFITGTNYENHGVHHHSYWANRKVHILENVLGDYRIFQKFKGVRGCLYNRIFDIWKKRFDKKDLKVDSLFEKIENSRSIFVPGYNPSLFLALGVETAPLERGYGPKKAQSFYDTREYRYRKEVIFRELESEIIGHRDFLMCHFHRPDQFQHYFGDKDIGNYDRNKLAKMYNEMDDLAADIKSKAIDAGYDYVIFMSDHGLPGTKLGHNENAFYSCNRDLFSGKTPKITDFYDKILSKVGE